MRVLVTGAAGMLGSEVVRSAPAGVEAVGVDLPDGDLTIAAEAEALVGSGVEGVIHTAAFTDVDGAEEREDEAHRVNAVATGHVAAACAARGLPLVVVGTDFVFDGTATRPYVEEDATAPLGAYGRTKLAGETAAFAAHPHGTRVVRTQWLYGPRGRHFPGTMLRLAETNEELRVVDDQRGSPTSTLELAPALWDVLRMGPPGLYHAACEGSCTWYGLASEVFRLAGRAVRLRPCTTAEFPRPARRPAFSVLDSTRLKRLRGRSLASWRDALRDFFDAGPRAD